MDLEWHRDWTPEQKGGGVRLNLRRRWIRVAAYYGQPPGSHIGLWRTRVDDLSGLNLRIGRRYIGPCVTALIHTRPQHHYERTPS